MTVTAPTSLKPIPITVFTGFLGAGKTSLILSLLPRLPKDYKVVLLKNEFGDIEVDSQLAKQSSLTAVSEILNGCMCCVLVGQMKTALLEIRGNFVPNSVHITNRGSAFPATLAFQIRELERETNHDLKLDAIITVIDAENFTGYEDESPTARMQASYTDMIIINKWESISERALDILIDHLNTLNDLTPKIRAEGRKGVDPNLIFGLDSKLYLTNEDNKQTNHHDEVETVTIFKGSPQSLPKLPHSHECHDDSCTHGESHSEHSAVPEQSPEFLSEAALQDALSRVSKESVWRVKGFVRTEKGLHILNWAFGRYDLTHVETIESMTASDEVKLTVMGERGEVRRAGRKLAEALGGAVL
ncbi:cobW-domain-containing protein [Trametopsis cervina]|nr:cobW-domain-containing protein [Trametopsis cervina]